MTLAYLPLIGFYCGWQRHFHARKLHFSCTRSSISAAYRQFELIWEWSDPDESGPQTGC